MTQVTFFKPNIRLQYRIRLKYRRRAGIYLCPCLAVGESVSELSLGKMEENGMLVRCVALRCVALRVCGCFACVCACIRVCPHARARAWVLVWCGCCGVVEYGVASHRVMWCCVVWCGVAWRGKARQDFVRRLIGQRFQDAQATPCHVTARTSTTRHWHWHGLGAE